MRYRWLGKTGFKVSEIGFGAWAIGGAMWGPQDDRDSRLALHKALDMGCNFIDTALAYGDGHSERLIASVLQERNQRVCLATKVPPKNWTWDNPPGTPLAVVFPPDYLRSRAEESLRNLRSDCLDVLQLHTWDRSWNTQAGPLLAEVSRLKREGKIRAFGISLRDKGQDEANGLIRLGMVDTLQVFFNLLYQDPLKDLMPLVRQYQVGFIARVPLAFGALSGKFTPKTRFQGDDHRRHTFKGEGLQETLAKVQKLRFLESRSMSLAEAAIKWTLAYPEVSTSIPGIRNIAQAMANCGAGDGTVVSKAQAQRAQKLYAGNFGLPRRILPSSEGVQALFMSGVRVKLSPTPKSTKAPTRRKTKPKNRPGKKRTTKRKPKRKNH